MNWRLVLAINLLATTLAYAEEQIVLPNISVSVKKDALSDQRISNIQKQVFDRKEIENLGVMTIGEVLNRLPGIDAGSAISDGSSTPRARGMSRDSVDVRVDGERPAGGSRIVSGVVGRLPVGDLERVEILRGSSAEYGGSASVTINLVMKKTLAKKSTALKAALGLNERAPTGQFTITQTGGEGDFSWSLPVTLNLHRIPSERKLNREDNASGTRTLWEQERDYGFQTFREFVITPRMTWKSGRDSLTISPLLFDGLRKRENDANLFTLTNPADGTGFIDNGNRFIYEQSHRQLMRLRAEGEKYFSDTKLSGRLALNHGKNSVNLARHSYNASHVLTNILERSNSHENEVNTALRWDQGAELHNLSIGVEYVRLSRHNDQNFAGVFVANNQHDATQSDRVLWVQDEWSPDDAFTLTTGLRAENMRMSADDSSQHYMGWLPSIAARWEPVDSWVVRTSLGAGLKMPRLDEISNATALSLTVNTPVEADRRGNPDLKPERSVNFEVVLERYLAKEAGAISANFYVRSTQDFTERLILKEGVRWIDRPYNVGDALHWGVEFDGKVKMDDAGWKGLTIKSHLTLPRTHVDDEMLGKRRIARDTPRYLLSMGLDQSLPKLQSSYGLSVQLSGRSETSVPTEQYGFTQSRLLLDAYWLYKLSPKFNLRVSGQNLLATNTLRKNQYVSGRDTWLLNTDDRGNRNLLLTLEGRW
jgi:iron complex outermembrane receptor protein